MHWLFFPFSFITPFISYCACTSLLSPMVVHYFNVYSFIVGPPSRFCPAVVKNTTGCVTRKVARWICNSVRGWVWAPRAVCLRIHLSTPNQILLRRRLSPPCPEILHSARLQGVQDKVKGLRFFLTRCPPTTPDPTRSPMPNPGQDQPQSPPAPTVSPKPQAIHFSVFVFSTMQSWKHFALLFLCVNMWMMICYKNVKYVKDHSLFWKNLHLSFWR